MLKPFSNFDGPFCLPPEIKFYLKKKKALCVAHTLMAAKCKKTVESSEQLRQRWRQSLTIAKDVRKKTLRRVGTGVAVSSADPLSFDAGLIFRS